MNETKVCPNCGCEHFESYEQITRVVIVDGEGTVVVPQEITDKALMNTLVCIDCKANLNVPSLVTESYFHEVIAIQGVPPSIDFLTKDQLHLMWESHYTIIENEAGLLYLTKSRAQKFGIVEQDYIDSLYAAGAKVLMVYKDKTHKTNFKN